MKELVVISGKGGTGKTSITASFAALAKNAALADCDVDAADLHLVLDPTIIEEHEFVGGKRARIIVEECVGCGKCNQVCVFGALHFDGPGNGAIDKTWRIDPVACEGCGVCAWSCPFNAIEFSPARNGTWFVSETRFGPMVHAKLGIAEENSGKLVTTVRTEARRIAEKKDLDLVIVDGPPGIGCPVIASVTGADFVLIVTEPTLSGMHDLDRVQVLTKHFKIPTAVCINKYDINEELSEAIEKNAEATDIPVLGKIAYDRSVTDAQIAKQAVVEYADNAVTKNITQLWNTITLALQGKNQEIKV